MRRDEERWHVPGEGGLSALAAQAGLQEHWVDAYGVPRRVSSDTLRSLLDSMGLPGGTAARVRESRAAVESIGSRPELLVGYAGGAVRLPGLPLGPCLLEPEEGSAPQAGLRIACDESGAWLRAPSQPVPAAPAVRRIRPARHRAVPLRDRCQPHAGAPRTVVGRGGPDLQPSHDR